MGLKRITKIFMRMCFELNSLDVLFFDFKMNRTILKMLFIDLASKKQRSPKENHKKKEYPRNVESSLPLLDKNENLPKKRVGAILFMVLSMLF